MSSALTNSPIAEDAWLASIMGRPVFRLTVPNARTPDVERDIRNAVQGWDEAFAFAKIATANIAAAQFLEDLGFRLVDTRLGLEKSTAVSPTGREEGEAGCEIRAAKSLDAEAVVDLARRSFVYSRFHLDPQIPKALADRIKAEWVGNFFKGKRGDQMMLAQDAGKVVGFNQILVGADQGVIIDLIAVDPAWRGRGIAAELICAAEQRYPQRTRTVVGTQAANVPSLRLYQRLGFRIFESEYIFHWQRSTR